jgi:transcriptional regulator with XRE-family HTH domain
MRLSIVTLQNEVARIGGRGHLARRMKVSVGRVSQIMTSVESGSDVTERMAGRLARALRVDVATLRAESGSDQPQPETPAGN